MSGVPRAVVCNRLNRVRAVGSRVGIPIELDYSTVESGDYLSIKHELDSGDTGLV
jgi:hypothetical protein